MVKLQGIEYIPLEMLNTLLIGKRLYQKSYSPSIKTRWNSIFSLNRFPTEDKWL
jgi:hypothetical protein